MLSIRLGMIQKSWLAVPSKPSITSTFFTTYLLRLLFTTSMPSLRDLSLERDQELNQLRARINQLGKTGKKEANDFVGSNISSEPVYDTVIQTGQSSNATNSFVQETIQKTKQKESGQPYIIPQKKRTSA